MPRLPIDPDVKRAEKREYQKKWYRKNRAKGDASVNRNVRSDEAMQIPVSVIADRNRRLSYIAKTPTEYLCGDPRPGQSALDQKRKLTNQAGVI